jgi:hypothetical protein
MYILGSTAKFDPESDDGPINLSLARSLVSANGLWLVRFFERLDFFVGKLIAWYDGLFQALDLQVRQHGVTSTAKYREQNMLTELMPTIGLVTFSLIQARLT